MASKRERTKPAGISHSTLESYPQVFWEFVERAKAGESWDFPLPTENLAINLRHRFHYFRRDLIRQRYPGAEVLTGLVLQLQKGSSTIRFVNLNEIYKTAVQEAKPESRPAEPISTDHGERLIEDWLKADGKQDVSPGLADKPQETNSEGRNQAAVATGAESATGETTPESIDEALGTGPHAETEEEKAYRRKVETCKHKWDMYGSCMGCGVSKIAWEQGTWKRS